MHETAPSPEDEAKTPSQEIADMLRHTYGVHFGFDKQTLEELAAMPAQEAIQEAYGALSYIGFSESEVDQAMAPWTERPE